MARHNPGDRPTHNVRTAPTPTTEEPPVGPGMEPEDGGVPAYSTGQVQSHHVHPSGHQFLRVSEEVSRNDQ